MRLRISRLVVYVVVGVVTATATKVPEFTLVDPAMSMQVTETALVKAVSVFVTIFTEL